jgi:hypothetical protein
MSKPWRHTSIGGVKLYLHSFLTSALVRGEWSVSQSGRFTSDERTTILFLWEAVGGHRAAVHEVSCPAQICNPKSPARIHITIPTTLTWWRRSILVLKVVLLFFTRRDVTFPTVNDAKLSAFHKLVLHSCFLNLGIATCHGPCHQWKKQHYELCATLIRVSLACFIPYINSLRL